MQRYLRTVSVLVVLAVVMGLTFVDAGAQTRKKRRARRVTRPVVTNPTITPAEEQSSTTSETRVLSTADETTAEQTPGDETAKSKNKKTTPPAEDMQQTINALSNQVNRLTDKLTQMQTNERSLLDMERLTRAEQRSEALRQQQLDTETKLADFHAQQDQVEYSLKPENIERSMAGYGTTRPEEAREARRRQLESEKARLAVQIRILETSRTRLETAVATADAEVDMLRRRLQQNDATPPASDTKPLLSEKP